jgi:hypothetical protein
MKTTIDMQNSIKGTKIALGGILFLSLLSGAGYSQNNNVCTINADNKGNFTSMIVSNPLTSLGIEKSFFFEVDNIGIPVKGTVSSLNGADRELKTPEELILMWAQFGGPRAFWDYNAKQGKIPIPFTGNRRGFSFVTARILSVS